jgi:hypothetical protein
MGCEGFAQDFINFSAAVAEGTFLLGVLSGGPAWYRDFPTSRRNHEH